MRKNSFREISIHILVLAFWTFGTVLPTAGAPGEIITVAGTGEGEAFLGDGGPATRAFLLGPAGVFVDGTGNLYISDTGNNLIRKVDLSGIITTIEGGPFSPPSIDVVLDFPLSVFMDALENLYIADHGNHQIRKVDTSSGIVTSVAGSTGGFSGDGGPATRARLVRPKDVFVDGAGHLYISDTGNHRIRKVDASSGIITTVAGNGTRGFSGDGGSATSAALDEPAGIFVDGPGTLYIADWGNHRLRKVDPSGTITTVAGSQPGPFPVSGFSGDGGPATRASLAYPTGVFMDGAGNLYIADTANHRIRKVDASSGIITTVAGGGDTGWIHGGFSGDEGRATRARHLPGCAYQIYDRRRVLTAL